MPPMAEAILENIFNSVNFSFEKNALSVFRFQYTHNPVYKQFVDLLKVNPDDVHTMEKIPFLPIEFYKSHKIITDNAEIQKVFESSGTTDSIRSKHFVADLNLYKQVAVSIFEQTYGDLHEWTILALLPSYLERDNSSLVYMVDDFIKRTQSVDSGFYLDHPEQLIQKLLALKEQGKKILLIGVTFALLDLAEQFPADLSGITIMETGGMKGRREDMQRSEIHAVLSNAFRVNVIHSEYGMTELLSQAYSKGNGIFEDSRYLKVLKREINEPTKVSASVGRGGLNVIDLANIYSCSFIATEDVVHILPNNQFEVLGRLDYAEMRGCNMLVI